MTRAPEDTSRLPALDGLRGIAILGVMWHHAFAEPRLLVPFSGNLSSAIHNLAYAGWSGVDLFFVLSGFLITGILLDARGSTSYFRGFYGRRALRIFPLYYATIAAVCVFFAVYHRSDAWALLQRLPWLLTYTPNVAMALKHRWYFSIGLTSLDHFWSLAVEEQFYLVWPTIVVLCSRRTLRGVCMAAIGVALASRAVAYLHFQNHWLTDYQLPCRADALAIGALTAIRYRERATFGKNAIAELVASSVLVVITLSDERTTYLFGLTALAWFYSCILTLALTTRLGRPLCFAPLRSFGKYSYGLYVIHVLLLPYLWMWLGFESFPWHRRVVFAVALIAASYVAALLSWHLFEKHFLALKKYFPMGSGTARSTNAPIRESSTLQARSLQE